MIREALCSQRPVFSLLNNSYGSDGPGGNSLAMNCGKEQVVRRLLIGCE